MPSSPISRASAIFAMSPRCPRFQSVIPTRTATGLIVSFVCAGPETCVRAMTGAAADAAIACVTKSRRVISIWIYSQLEFQNVVPPLAVFRSLDERGRFRGVAGAQVLVIPLDLLPGAVGHVAEMIRFGGPAGVLEVRAGFWTETLCVVDPLH